jgi:hypothetical protein
MKSTLSPASFYDSHHADHAAVGVVPGVEEQGLERCIRIALRGRQVAHDPLQDVLDADAGLGRYEDRVVGVDPHHVLDLLADPVRVGGRQVDLVEDRDDGQVVVDRQVGVGQRLGLDSLRGVDHQEGPLAGREAARDLIGEVDVARRVDQVELVGLAIPGLVEEPHGARLDGDAPLALEVHVIEHLVDHVAIGDRLRELKDAVRQRRLAMVDVGNDGEVADALVRPHTRRTVSGAGHRITRHASSPTRHTGPSSLAGTPCSPR